MTGAVLIQLCTRCGRPLTEHQAPEPADRDPVAWDLYVSGACSREESMQRLETAVERGVSISRMLEAQSERSR